MASRIEQMIDEIEEYIDGCKAQAFSSSKIVVNKEEIEELLSELREKTPREIERYQKIISNKEAILADAQTKADSIIAKAQVKTDQLVSEHQIMQQAYAQADEVVMAAQRQAQDIIDNATNEANSIRIGAMQYTDDILRNLESVISSSLAATRNYTDSYMGTLQSFLDTVSANRAELNPTAEDFSEDTSSMDREDGLPKIEITSDIMGK